MDYLAEYYIKPALLPQAGEPCDFRVGYSGGRVCYHNLGSMSPFGPSESYWYVPGFLEAEAEIEAAEIAAAAKPFEHENDEPEFLLKNARAIAADIDAWNSGSMTAEAFEDAWGYDDPERCLRALEAAIASQRARPDNLPERTLKALRTWSHGTGAFR